MIYFYCGMFAWEPLWVFSNKFKLCNSLLFFLFHTHTHTNIYRLYFKAVFMWQRVARMLIYSIFLCTFYHYFEFFATINCQEQIVFLFKNALVENLREFKQPNIINENIDTSKNIYSLDMIKTKVFNIFFPEFRSL